MENKEEKLLKGFTQHGFKPVGESGNQRYGDCPFCGRENKFYLNIENGLWDCKVCGLKGNHRTFLANVSNRNAKELRGKALQVISKDRGLPQEAFTEISMGFWDGKYTLTVKDSAGHLQDMRMYKPGASIMGTSLCKTGLWNMHSLVDAKPELPVYVCEGEWDGIAMLWLAKHLKKEILVVAVPGANTFKKEWCSLFQGRKVYCLYDHDEAGEEGQLTVQERLTGVASSIEYIHWPDVLPTGFDIRDLITRRAVKRRKPKSCWNKIHKMLKPSPIRQKEAVLVGRPGAEHRSKERAPEPVKPIKFTEVLAVIKKWLFLKSTDGIEIAVATMLSNKLGGDPLWMFIVATPGGAKTEILSTLQQCPESYFTSSLTPHSLISGAAWSNGHDPSLIPKLDQKVLIIKDFTTILTKRDQEKDEIFGILRDAYDGNCSKVFGTGVKRSYVSKFSILSAVTPKIYELAETHQSLGERFLKFCIGENLEHDSEMEIIERAINNLQQEDGMRQEMGDKMAQFIAWKYQCMAEGNAKRPTIPLPIQRKLIALAQFGARMRGIVGRDKYRPEIVNASPSSEVGSRLGKQLAKLLISLALVNDRDEVNENDYRLVRKCMLDTISQKTERVVRELFRKMPTGGTITTSTISRETRFPQATIKRLLDDLDLLRIVQKSGSANKYEWALSDYIRELVSRAGLYETEQELNRTSLAKHVSPVRVKLRIRKTK